MKNTRIRGWRMKDDATIVTVMCDTGMKYLHAYAH